LRREDEGHTLQPTALVNEAFLRLCGSAPATWQDRAHFYAVCAQVMRHILTDHARAHLRVKRGAGAVHLPLDAAATVVQQQPVDHAALDDALRALEAHDARKARIVELRYFVGLGIEETAQLLDISPMTVRREWTRAKAWLYRELAEGGRS
jgi:RNA polymerase sigma-70 factor, ECF subfamily